MIARARYRLSLGTHNLHALSDPQPMIEAFSASGPEFTRLTIDL
jgi:hypothetical protein